MGQEPDDQDKPRASELWNCCMSRRTLRRRCPAAARAGQADPAHMTREVQRMSGATASEFVAQVLG